MRLVAEGMSSKEIARQLSLTPLTVDTYLKAAMARTGAANRRDAARLLRQWELSQNSGSPLGALVPSPSPPDEEASAQPGEQGAAGTADGADAGGIAFHDAEPERPSRLSWRLPPVGGRSNDLKTTERFAEIAKIAVAAAMAMAALVTLTTGAMRLLTP